MSATPPQGPPGDVAKVSVYVAVSPADAFEVFTREVDQWWRTGPKYRVAARRPGRLTFEEGVGGRLFETFGDDGAPGETTKTRTIELGKITVWEPPSRFSFVWRGVNFAPHEATTVDVTFEPSGDGTMVTVRHHGWSTLRPDHPARHGLAPADFVRMMGMWWGGLLTSLREHAATR